MTTKEFRELLRSDLLFYKIADKNGNDRYVAMFDMCSIFDAYVIVLVIYGSYYRIFCRSDITGKDLVRCLYYSGFETKWKVWEHIRGICNKARFVEDCSFEKMRDLKNFLVQKIYSGWSLEQLEMKRERIVDKIVEIEIGQLLA